RRAQSGCTPVARPTPCSRGATARCRTSSRPAPTSSSKSTKRKRLPTKRPDRTGRLRPPFVGPHAFIFTRERNSGVSMAEITAGMVKELREKTDAPMMECKKALTEAAGDIAKAEEILRVKLGSKASKAASRVTAEGVVAIHISADG